MDQCAPAKEVLLTTCGGTLVQDLGHGLSAEYLPCAIIVGEKHLRIRPQAARLLIALMSKLGEPVLYKTLMQAISDKEHVTIESLGQAAFALNIFLAEHQLQFILENEPKKSYTLVPK